MISSVQGRNRLETGFFIRFFISHETLRLPCRGPQTGQLEGIHARGHTGAGVERQHGEDPPRVWCAHVHTHTHTPRELFKHIKGNTHVLFFPVSSNVQPALKADRSEGLDSVRERMKGTPNQSLQREPRTAFFICAHDAKVRLSGQFFVPFAHPGAIARTVLFCVCRVWPGCREPAESGREAAGKERGTRVTPEMVPDGPETWSKERRQTQATAPSRLALLLVMSNN